MQDLLIVDYWNQKINDRFPVYYNFLQQGGYFTMPSARMGQEGEFGFGGAWVPPYHQYSLRAQLIDRLEITGCYRVFKGVDDPVLSSYGFGDFSDKGANIKFALFLPEDSRYEFPGIAFGLEDFMGTKAFEARYVVMTQVFKEYHLEISLGYGSKRIRKWFGGLCWAPFRRSQFCLLESLAFVLEYDAIPYKNPKLEPHPKGRLKRTPWNFGVKWRPCYDIDLSLGVIRGDALAFSLSTDYNFGYTQGFLPKIDNPLVCRKEGRAFDEQTITEDFVQALDSYGFELLQAWISPCKTLRLRLINGRYPQEHQVKEHLMYLLGCYVPDEIDSVIVVIDENGCPIQEYRFLMSFIRSYTKNTMGALEISILTPMKDATFPNLFEETPVFYRHRDLWEPLLLPKTQTFFGSANGKFKYSLGVQAGLEGYIFNDVYYSILLGYTFFSKLSSVSDMDRLNPSQLINVRTDIINYYKVTGLTLDQAYLEKSWALGKGWYTRFAVGYFEQCYGGVGGEFLYYPVGSAFAIGAEGAIVKKRKTTGLGFSNYIRKLNGFIPTYRRFLGSQYFLNLHYDWALAKLDMSVKIGKFLANDQGARYTISRYFPSGLRVSVWYTYTNGNDKINGQIYHDQGICFSMPLDIFYTRSSRERWSYSISAWLRDVGATSSHGRSLFSMIDDQRKAYP